MKSEIKTLWVEALRSGLYKQGYSRLITADPSGREASRFCCLGVLCNLHAKANPRIESNSLDPHSYLGSVATLPWEVYVWSGLDSNNPIVKAPPEDKDSGCLKTLAEINDSGKFDFIKIASIIEEQL